MTLDDFVGISVMDMVNRGVTIQIAKHKTFGDPDYSMFSTDKRNKFPIFRVIYDVGDRDEFFETFVHEYAHFLQWKLGMKSYDDLVASLIAVDKWLKAHMGKRKNTKLKMRHLRNVQMMELDCDKRAIGLIRKMNLGIDLDTYVQKSNSYILSYNYMFERRDFSICGESFTPEAISLMPTRQLTIDEIIAGIPEHRAVMNPDG